MIRQLGSVGSVSNQVCCIGLASRRKTDFKNETLRAKYIVPRVFAKNSCSFRAVELTIWKRHLRRERTGRSVDSVMPLDIRRFLAIIWSRHTYAVDDSAEILSSLVELCVSRRALAAIARYLRRELRKDNSQFDKKCLALLQGFAPHR